MWGPGLAGGILRKIFLLSVGGILILNTQQEVSSKYLHRLKVIQTLNFAKIVHFCDYLENGALW